MHLPVKRVETETVITHVVIGRVQPGQIDLSTGPGRQSHRETRHSRTAESCHRDRPQRHLRGQVAWTTTKQGYTQTWFCHKDTPQRYPHGHMARSTDVLPRTPINTKKSLRTISRLKTLSKHGGFLLSHLVWQYHRR